MIVTASLPAYGGYTIVRDDKIILVKGAIPGEVVEIIVQERKRDYLVGTVSQVVEPSQDRVGPICPVFGVCGGCQLQYVRYERQLRMKEDVLRDSLARLGDIQLELGESLSGTQWHYRHRAQFKVSPQGIAGFFRESSRDVVELESCPLMRNEINTIFQRVKAQGLARGLKEIHLCVGDTAAALLRYDAHWTCAPERFREAGISSIACNDELAEGAGYIRLQLPGLNYTVSPQTFFQAHWELNTRVAEFIMQESGVLADKTVVDLYAGAGNFSLPLAGRARDVVLVEENPHAVEDGMRNVKLNRLRNCRFVKSSAEKYRMQKKADLLILDPPRPGLTGEVAKKVLEHVPDKIFYISCNPSTLARDLKKLKAKYDITTVRLVDFFPNTYHIEAVVFLQIR